MRGRVDHLAIKVVLLLHGVVGLQGRRSDLDGVGKDLCSVLDLLGFIGKRLFFVLDLHDGVAGLRGVEDDAGAELRVRGSCAGEEGERYGERKTVHTRSPLREVTNASVTVWVVVWTRVSELPSTSHS